MTSQNDRLHVTFGQSAAGSLQLALASLGLGNEPVATFCDDHSMGPVGDGNQRAEWQRTEWYGHDPIACDDVVVAFWEQVSAWPGRLVVWMSSWASAELCGLHLLCWRLPQANIHVIDVSTVDFVPDTIPIYDERQAFSIVRDERIVQHSLLERAKPLSDLERAELRSTWARLRDENAPLRVVTDTGLVSQPITYFDERIRAPIQPEWQRCARVVGTVLSELSQQRLRELDSDVFVFTRLLRLIDTCDDIEGRNDDGDDAPWSMRRSSVRRVPAASVQ